MFNYAKRLRSIVHLSFILFLGVLVSQAQTFRGGINGSVTDANGAVAVGAQVVATDDETGIVHSTVSSSAGDFTFSDLPLGHYTIVVTASGFAVETVKAIPVSAGSVYTAPIHLSVAGSATEVSVSASALTLDTTTVTQTTVVDEKAVDSVPLNGRDFTQLVALTPGFAGYSAGGDGSLNGTRFDQINWQIDGIDNNDLWANIPAVNQGGVLGIAGIILPIDAIDQFSVQTQGNAEAGRSPGGIVNLGLKSGTNKIHGSGYYFNRNEAYAKATPFLGYGATKLRNRNYNLGFSVGGPVLHDKLFYFAAFEKQVFQIGQSGLATEPSAAYQAQSTALLAKYGVAVNPVSLNLLNTLWPTYSLTGPAQGENYASPDPEAGHSYNGIFKADYAINSKNNISFHGFQGEGNQQAPEGSQLIYYYEVAPIHVQNYAIVLNSTISNSLNNQLLLGVNYFNQTFNDSKKNFDLASTGFVTGSLYPTVAPHIRISGFDSVGIVAPSGRNDIVGHITDTASLTKGKHDLRFGGEYRQAQIDAFNTGNSTGLFRFSGGVGPWAGDATVTDNNVKSLADFLAGYVRSGSTLATGDPKRQIFVNTFDMFAQDAWRLSPRLTLNYGVRYDYEGAPHDPYKNLSIFLPNRGFVFQGSDIPALYSANKTAFSPRLGFSYQPHGSNDIVVRGGFGIYYDQPIMAAFLNNHTSNSSPIGVQANPAGNNPFFTITNAKPVTFQTGVPLFNTTSPCNVAVASASPCGAFTIDQNFSTPYVMSYNLNVQKSFGPKIVAQLGYIGNESRKLLATRDINQAAFNTEGSADQTTRPFYSAYPNLSNINQLGTFGTGNYNSLQSTLRLSDYHGITTQVSYTWSHAFDEVSVSRSTLPQDSNNFLGDYGKTDLDTTHTFSTYVTYSLPNTMRGPKLLTNGWQINSLINLHSGQPFTVYNSEDTSGTDENAQRVNLIGNPFAGVSHTFTKANATNGGATEQWVNPAAFAEPAPGTLGTEQRNDLRGPGYSDVDLSFFKTTPITERVKVQIRIEMFNIFNRNNFAPPVNTLGAGFGTLNDTIGDYFGAPGIGPGEPFNMQLGGKIVF